MSRLNNLNNVFKCYRGEVAELFSILRVCKDAGVFFCFLAERSDLLSGLITQEIPLNSEFYAFFILCDPYYFAIHPVILFQNAFCTKLICS